MTTRKQNPEEGYILKKTENDTKHENSVPRNYMTHVILTVVRNIKTKITMLKKTK
jgi:hypothetical protein